MSAPILHINGWAGAGKRTIAAALAQSTSARLIDNHALLNPVLALYDHGDDEAPTFRAKLRSLVFEELATLPSNLPLIFTDALADDAYCRGLIVDVFQLAQRRNAVFTTAVLDIDEGENIKRLASDERIALRKLTNPEILTKLRSTETLLTATADHMIRLDVTHLSALDAARVLQTRWLRAK